MCLSVPGNEGGEGNGGAILHDATAPRQKRPSEEHTNGRKPNEV